MSYFKSQLIESMFSETSNNSSQRTGDGSNGEMKKMTQTYLIDKTATINAFERMAVGLTYQGKLKEATDYAVAAKVLRESDLSEVVEAEPVRHGRWETYPSHADRRCSVCKYEWDKPRFNIRANYCPNCGAKMDGGIKE